MPHRYASRLNGLEGNAIREIFKLLANPNIISFAGGNPAPQTFDEDMTSEIIGDLLELDGKTVLQYGATEGYKPLLESAVPYLQDMGVVCEGRGVLPVSGGQQGVDLMMKALIDPGDTVLVESPTFLGALHTMRTYQANIVPVEMDEDGVLPEKLEAAIRAHNPKVAYLIPTFQNPTGRTLTVERRKAVARIAEQYGLPILEDDPYRDLRYHGEAVLPIQHFDTSGMVTYMTSFSKVISPGLRVGALVAEPDLLRKLTICKQAADVHTSNLTQAVIDGYLRRGVMPSRVRAIRDLYRAQMDAMLGALEGFPKGVKHTRPQGGLFIWVELPEGMDALELLPKAVAKGVAYVPGTHFYPQGGHDNTLRLNFSMASAERIRQGMALLKDVIEEAM